MNKFRSLLAGGFLFCLLASMKLHAQVVMAAQVPPAGIIQQSQLWNMVLTNLYPGSVRVSVIMRLSEVNTGQGILTGFSNEIELPAGAKQIQLKDLIPVSYEYLSPVADRRENALLMPGNYSVCYSVIVSGDKSGQPATEDCRNFTVEPVSPPMLNTPVNEALLDALLPQFTWIPPAPLNLFSDLNYDLVLVEMGVDQSAEEAVQVNIPVYRVSNLRQPFMNYPAGAPALDTGITYAWMVTANNGRQFAAQTNTWTFRMKQSGMVSQEDLSAYVQLKRNSNDVMNCGDVLKCSYVNDAGDEQVKYEITSLENDNHIVRQGNISLQPGTNMIELSLSRGSRLSAGKLYMFRLHNGRSENWEIKFVYHPAP
ncbi:hypothetical protein ACTJJ0_24245 [Chitinophaga sp. 22321]|uniref:DUF928 domain-containing protein n=1 Tax=Chitinophaga hostae TaxID=2831022 RepID=A0ABS5J5Y7_9BACT|nr:hypothetical protein [Chitinophaga hostae]MBS0030638.1 hypothetical protein [Chitinophaga hostae]